MKKLGPSDKFNWLQTLILGIVLFIGGLITGIILSFPSGILEQKLVHEIEKQGQVSVDPGHIGLGLLTVKGQDVVVRSQQNLWPPIEVSSFEISPLWTSIFSGNPGVQLNSRVMAGELNIDLYKNGTLDVSANGLQLKVPFQNGWNLEFSGIVPSGDIHSSIPLDNTSESDVNLTLTNVRISETGSDTAMINLGNIELQASGRGQAFRITTLEAEQGDFAVSGRGNLRLGQTPASSLISLRMEIRPQASADPGLVELLKMAARERSEGLYELRISGNLATPSFK